MYKEKAVRQLKQYSVTRVQQQILQAKITALKDRYSRLPRWMDKDAKEAEINRLEAVYNSNREFLQDVDNLLEILPERYRTVLWHFYIRRTDDYMEILNEKLNVERTQIYRLKDKALQTYAMLSIDEFY